MDALSAFSGALLAEVEAGSCLGVTARVLLSGVEVAHIAIGQAWRGRALATHAALPWYSASKLLATVAVACAWEADLLAPEDRVSDHIPEFASGGKDDIRIEHLMAHTAPLRGIDRAVGGAFDRGRDALVRMVVAAQADSDWVPGERAGYLGHAGYLMLDEIVARASGTTFSAFQQEHVIARLGLASRLGGGGLDVIDVPWFGPPEFAERVGLFDLSQGYPSACVAGPFGDAATVCELLRQGGELGGRRLLRRHTCAVLLTDHRPFDMIDESAGRARRWGLGVALAAENFGPASGQAFGALGGTACMVFSDPKRNLTAAVHFNGNTGPAERVNRDRRVACALYADLDRLATGDVS